MTDSWTVQVAPPSFYVSTPAPLSERPSPVPHSSAGGLVSTRIWQTDTGFHPLGAP